MLVSPPQGRALPGRGWRLEPKLDGWRVIVTVDGALTVQTRRGRDITACLPELAGLAGVLAGHQVVLDAELIAGDGRMSDFYLVGPRLAAGPRRAEPPLRLAVFDLLWLDGDLCRRPYTERRVLLEGLALRAPGWQTIPAFDCDAAGLLAACARLGLEGIVAKRPGSLYYPGRRSSDWIKVKTGAWRVQHAGRRHSHPQLRGAGRPQVLPLPPTSLGLPRRTSGAKRGNDDLLCPSLPAAAAATSSAEALRWF